jgi:hypothetical protein
MIINDLLVEYLNLVNSETHDVVSCHISAQRNWNKTTNKYDVKYMFEVLCHDGQWRETKMDGDDLYRVLKDVMKKFKKKNISINLDEV